MRKARTALNTAGRLLACGVDGCRARRAAAAAAAPPRGQGPGAPQADAAQWVHGRLPRQRMANSKYEYVKRYEQDLTLLPGGAGFLLLPPAAWWNTKAEMGHAANLS
jgi:hypothetical protein